MDTRKFFDKSTFCDAMVAAIRDGSWLDAVADGSLVVLDHSIEDADELDEKLHVSVDGDLSVDDVFAPGFHSNSSDDDAVCRALEEIGLDTRNKLWRTYDEAALRKHTRPSPGDFDRDGRAVAAAIRGGWWVDAVRAGRLGIRVDGEDICPCRDTTVCLSHDGDRLVLDEVSADEDEFDCEHGLTYRAVDQNPDFRSIAAIRAALARDPEPRNTTNTRSTMNEKLSQGAKKIAGYARQGLTRSIARGMREEVVDRAVDACALAGIEEAKARGLLDTAVARGVLGLAMAGVLHALGNTLGSKSAPMLGAIAEELGSESFADVFETLRRHAFELIKGALARSGTLSSGASDEAVFAVLAQSGEPIAVETEAVETEAVAVAAAPKARPRARKS